MHYACHLITYRIAFSARLAKQFDQHGLNCLTCIRPTAARGMSFLEAQRVIVGVSSFRERRERVVVKRRASLLFRQGWCDDDPLKFCR